MKESYMAILNRTKHCTFYGLHRGFSVCGVLLGPPQIVAAYQQRHRILSADRLRLPCPVESVPPPRITWQKDGVSFVLGWDPFSTNEDARVIRIQELQSPYSGVFICRAT